MNDAMDEEIQAREERKNIVKNVEDKIRIQMKEQAFFKTLITIFLSFSSLFFLMLIKSVFGKWNEIDNDLLEFFVKGSLLTIAISNISGIISNLVLEKRNSITKNSITVINNDKNTTHHTIEYKEMKYLALFSMMLIFLGITYSGIIITEMNTFLVFLCLILYGLNILLMYKFNYFREKINSDKYNNFNESMNDSYNTVESGKNIKSDGDYKL